MRDQSLAGHPYSAFIAGRMTEPFSTSHQRRYPRRFGSAVKRNVEFR